MRGVWSDKKTEIKFELAKLDRILGYDQVCKDILSLPDVSHSCGLPQLSNGYPGGTTGSGRMID